MPGTLDSRAREFGTDKSSLVNDYCRFYESHLFLRASRIRRVLELGIKDGASMLMWGHWLPHATVIGFDISLKHVCEAARCGPQYIIQRGDVTKFSDLLRLAKLGPFDLIVDDASHRPSDQIGAWCWLWPYLNPGGLYAIEDVCCSYWPEYGGGGDGFGQWLLRRMDAVHLHGARKHGDARAFATVQRHNELTDEARTIEAIHVYNSLVIMEKRAR